MSSNTIPGRYRKLPVTIDAMQWLGGPEHAEPILEWIKLHDGNARYIAAGEWHPLRKSIETFANTPEFIVIDTLEGPHRMDVFDFAIRGVANEFYPCKSDIFAQTYETAPEGS